MKRNGLFVYQLAVPAIAGTADDRCQWQMKGGMPYTEYDTITNKVKWESATR